MGVDPSKRATAIWDAYVALSRAAYDELVRGAQPATEVHLGVAAFGEPSRVAGHNGIYEHRAIAEWKLGRPLHHGEIVHHRNGDRHDNHPDNLEVLPSQRTHMQLHHLERREPRGQHALFDRNELLRAWGP